MASRSDMLARLAATAAGLGHVPTPAGRLCEAARILASADGASLTLAQDDEGLERIVLWSTDSVAARLEDIHDALGEGPAFDALRDGTVVDAAGPDDVSRWPLFAELATRDTTVWRISAFPMLAGSASLGVLLLYLTSPGTFAYELADLAVLADLVAVMLVENTPIDSLPEASTWGDRSTVNQAAGMVMAQLSIPATDALALLRAHAFALDTTLIDVAHQVLDRRLALQPPEAP